MKIETTETTNQQEDVMEKMMKYVKLTDETRRLAEAIFGKDSEEAKAARQAHAQALAEARLELCSQ